MLILGLNVLHPDASAAIVEDGMVVFAIAEERLNRQKHYSGFPSQSIRACLGAMGADISDIDHVAVGRCRDEDLSETAKQVFSSPTDREYFLRMRGLRSEVNHLKPLLARSMDMDIQRMRFQEHHVEHHVAHISSAFYCSGWDRAAGLSYDGSGDFVSTMFALCQGTEVRVLRRVGVPHSLGTFYTAFCEFLGFGKFGNEGKFMGLSAHGEGTYCEQVRDIISPHDGTFVLNLDYFPPFIVPEGTRVVSRRHFGDKIVELFGGPREPYSEVTTRDKDVAYAVQRRFEEILFYLLHLLHKQAPCDRLVTAGGCALNSVANGKIVSETPFRETWIQPAAGDEGLAIGAALYTYHSVLKQPRKYVMKDAYLGPSTSKGQIRSALETANLKYQRLEREQLLRVVARQIASGNIVGWFQGRMEWGPRALGNRSILAHPGLPESKTVLNARIKHREWFRPFAASVLAEYQDVYFEENQPSPFMLYVSVVRPEKRGCLCAVTHVDNTCRIQTVNREENPLYYDLIKAFQQETGLPVVLNTSFNENEPIVCTPEEAIDCFCRTHMDVLAIGPYLLFKDRTMTLSLRTRKGDKEGGHVCLTS